MARSLFFCMVVLGLVTGLAAARPAPAEAEVSDLQLGGRGLRARANAPASSASPDGAEPGVAGAPEGAAHRGARERRPFDKSMAGAEVILGGLAAAVFFAIFAYIRVTRTRSSDAKV